MKKKSPFILLITIIPTLLNAALPTPTGITWNTPVTLSSPGVDGSDPRIVIDSSGNATAVWLEGGALLAATQPKGGSWSGATTLTGSGASKPKLGVDGSGNVIALWLQADVVTSASCSLGGSWSVATSLSLSGASTPQLAVDSAGNAAAVWVRSTNIEASKQSVGASWGTVSVISSNNSDVPQVAIGADGTVAAIWHMLSSGSDIVSSSTSTISGSWGTAKNLVTAAPALHHNYPKIVVDASGNATAIWYRYNQSGSVYTNVMVLAGTLASGASTWGSFALLSSPGLVNPAGLVERLGVDSAGNVLAVWTNSYDGSSYWVESAEKLSSGWNTSVLLFPPNLYSYQVDSSVNATGHSLISYMMYDGTSLMIQAQEIDTSNPFPTLSLETTVSQGTENGYPRCAVCLVGNTENVVSTWVSNDGTNNTIQAANGTRTIIDPPSNLAVTQNSTNFGVFTEYYNTITWDASPAEDVNRYNIFRGGVFINAVDATTFQYVDHNATSGGSVTYGVAAVDSKNTQSSIPTVSYP